MVSFLIQNLELLPYERFPNPRLLGAWQYNGGACRVSWNGSSLTVVNEVPATEPASYDAGELVVPGWKTSARLSADGSELRWTNGTVWKRAR